MKISYPKLESFTIDIGKVNAFARIDIQAFETYLDKLETQFPEKRALLIQSHKISPHGFPIFCAGANQRERAEWSPQEILAHVQYQRSVLHRLRESPLYVIALVEGLALGLGTEFCLASDYVIATSDAIFAFPEKDWGIVPGAGGTAWAHGWAQNKLKAQEMILSGEKINAQMAESLGIVDLCCHAQDINFYIEKIMTQITPLSPHEQIQKKQTHWAKIDFERWFDLEHQKYTEAILTKFKG